MTFFVDPSKIDQDFYIVLATTIPILLFALLLRLAALRDIIIETLDDARDTRDISELREMASPDDLATHAKLDELTRRRAKSVKLVEALAPRAFLSLLATLGIAAGAEVASLAVVAIDRSSALSFYVASLRTATLAYSIASNEIASYKLSFGQRGLLLPDHLKRKIKP